MNPLDLLLLSLATFYVSYAVSSTGGPFYVFAWFREHFVLGGLTKCLVCLSPWVAAVLYVLLSNNIRWPIEILAVAGASVFVWRWTGGEHV